MLSLRFLIGNTESSYSLLMVKRRRNFRWPIIDISIFGQRNPTLKKLVFGWLAINAIDDNNLR